MSPLPSGTVTFLLTDVERSTPLWEQFPEVMRVALSRHDALMESGASRHNGAVVKKRGEGDSLFLTFASAQDAARAAIALQHALRAEAWPAETPLKVRMALHTGEADLRDEDYYGSAVNRCARIRATGHGGQVLLSQSTAELIRDQLEGEAFLRDLGLHHLKDLQRPERIYQLRHPDWPDDFGPLRSLSAFKHNLPSQLTSFVGREQELQDVRQLLMQTRLLTLLGSGGCGKTRLALQTSAEAVDDFANGVWLVELAPLTEDALVAQTIAKTLGIQDEPNQDALQTLCEGLRDRTLLLLLDNCEHLVEACARVVNALLQACPGLRVLATSRKPLNVVGEKSWRIPSLPLPDAQTALTVEDAMRHAALRLFVERASSARLHFALTPGNLPAVMEICRHLDGIPLAIELAAARVSALTPQQIASRFNDRFKLLVGGKRDVSPRHQTLRALIDWSHDLLSEEERVLLRRLCVFAGGWTLEGAEAVCEWDGLATGDAMNLLSHLVDASLVNVEETGSEAGAEEQAGASRYRLLETVREYAAEQLDKAGETATARAAHLRYFFNLAAEAEPKLTGAEQARWLRTLETEHDNLRAALKWAMDNDTRLQLAGALWRFWLMRSHFQEGRSWLSGALARSPQSPPHLCAKVLNGIGFMATRQGDFEEARRCLEESLRLRQNINDQAGMAESLNNLATVANSQGQSDEAQSLYTQSLNLWQSVGNPRGVAAALNNLGILFVNTGQYEDARSNFEQSLTFYRECNDRANMASTLGNLGVVCCFLEDYAQARTYYEEGLALDTEIGDRWGVALWLYNLGDVARKQGDLDAASRFLRDSLAIRFALGDLRGCAETLNAYAETKWELGHSESTVLLLAAAATLRQAVGLRLSNSAAQQNAHMLAAAQIEMSSVAFQAMWERGCHLSLERSMDYL